MNEVEDDSAKDTVDTGAVSVVPSIWSVCQVRSFESHNRFSSLAD